MKFSGLVKEARKTLKVSQLQLAEDINISSPTICNVEAGHIPYVNLAAKLALGLGLEMEQAAEAWAQTCKEKFVDSYRRRQQRG